MWLDSKAVNCPQKWGNFTHAFGNAVSRLFPNGCCIQRAARRRAAHDMFGRKNSALKGVFDK